MVFVGVMFSVARFRLALPTQFLFLIVNTLGLLLGIVYNSQTPNLYANNAHHKIGWISTWVVIAQAIMGLLFVYSGRDRDKQGSSYERATFLPVPTHVTGETHQSHPDNAVHEYRWSGDSGQGTERTSSSLHSRHPSLDM